MGSLRVLFAQGDGLALFLDCVGRSFFNADRGLVLTDATVFVPYVRSDF